MTLCAVLAAATAPSAAMPPSIPFRHTSIVSASEVSGILAATVLVLCVLAVSAWFARRKGWLDRWSVGSGKASAPAKSLVVLEVLRISRKTTIYRVADGQREFLVAESSAPVALAGSPTEPGPAP